MCNFINIRIATLHTLFKTFGPSFTFDAAAYTGRCAENQQISIMITASLNSDNCGLSNMFFPNIAWKSDEESECPPIAHDDIAVRIFLVPGLQLFSLLELDETQHLKFSMVTSTKIYVKVDVVIILD